MIQRKKDGSENFHRYWWEYEMGFGSLTGEFWFGLNALHCLTSQLQWELCIDLKLTNGTIIYLPYKKFAVGPGSEQYPLTISGFTGYTTDPIGTHNLNTMKFTTRDRDNDRWSNNCALHHSLDYRAGGWWYNDCTHMYLNGPYNNNKYKIYLNGQWQSPPFMEIKIRPINCA